MERLWQFAWIVAAGLYLASLLTPAFDGWNGYVVLGLGWVSLLHAFPGWLANPLLLAAFAFCPNHPDFAIRFSAASILVAIPVPFFASIPGDDGWTKPESWQIGSLLWASSIAVLFIAIVLRIVSDVKPSPTPHQSTDPAPSGDAL